MRIERDNQKARGFQYLDKGDYKKAASCFQLEESSLGDYYYQIALALQWGSQNPPEFSKSDHHFLEAEKIFKSSIKIYTIKPKDIDALYSNWGFSYYNRDTEKAKQYLNIGTKIGGYKSAVNLAMILSNEDRAESRTKAITLFKKYNNDPFSQYHYGRFLLLGSPEEPADEKNFLEGFALIEKASSYVLNAKLMLGSCFYIGMGVAQNKDKAFEIFQEIEAIQPKNVMEVDLINSARHNLGHLFYEKGNLNLAIQQFQKAANNGNVHSQIGLSRLHETGFGVELDIKLAENLLKSAAKNSSLGEKQLMDFNRRNSGQGLLKSDENVDQKGPKDVSLDKHFFKDINNIINEIANDKNLFREEKIRCLFTNIRLAEKLDDINLILILKKIGHFFYAIDKLPQIISQYILEIILLLEKIAQRISRLEAQQIATAVVAISKLHLNPEKNSPQYHCFSILLDKAKKHLATLNSLDLLFLIEGIARMGDFYDYLPPLIGRIRGSFHELSLSYLARLVYSLALIDNFQNSQKKRWFPIRNVRLLFSFIEKILKDSQNADLKTSSQLNLASQYFTRYSDVTCISLLDMKAESPTHTSNLQKNITDFIFMHVEAQEIKTEYWIAGLPVDICLIKERLIIQINGPSHFQYTLDQDVIKTPIRTAKDQFHDTLLKGAGYSIIYIAYFEWPAAFDEKIKLLAEKGLKLKSKPGCGQRSVKKFTLLPPPVSLSRSWASVAKDSLLNNCP